SMVARVAVTCSRDTGAQVDAEILQIRQRSDVFDKAAHGAGAVERTLRPTQHLDSIEIEQTHIQRPINTAGETAARSIGHLVEIDSNGRSNIIAHRRASQRYFCKARPLGRE